MLFDNFTNINVSRWCITVGICLECYRIYQSGAFANHQEAEIVGVGRKWVISPNTDSRCFSGLSQGRKSCSSSSTGARANLNSQCRPYHCTEPCLFGPLEVRGQLGFAYSQVTHAADICRLRVYNIIIPSRILDPTRSHPT